MQLGITLKAKVKTSNQFVLYFRPKSRFWTCITPFWDTCAITEVRRVVLTHLTPCRDLFVARGLPSSIVKSWRFEHGLFGLLIEHRLATPPVFHIQFHYAWRHYCLSTLWPSVWHPNVYLSHFLWWLRYTMPMNCTVSMDQSHSVAKSLMVFFRVGVSLS